MDLSEFVLFFRNSRDSRMDFRLVEQVHTGLLIAIQIQSRIQLFEDAHIVHYQAKILIRVHSVHTGDRLAEGYDPSAFYPHIRPLQ